MEDKQHNWYLSENFHPFVKLAFASMYSFIADGKRLGAQALPSEVDTALSDAKDELGKPSACFVSLKIAGQLRGCIGTIEPTTKDLAEEIIENAISASTRDPRFPRVQTDELPRLSVSVDVLSAPKQATEAELDPKKFGLIIEQGYRRGLLLPDLEGVDDVATQKRIVAQKGGIDLGQPHNLYTFTVDRYY